MKQAIMTHKIQRRYIREHLDALGDAITEEMGHEEAARVVHEVTGKRVVYHQIVNPRYPKGNPYRVVDFWISVVPDRYAGKPFPTEENEEIVYDSGLQ